MGKLFFFIFMSFTQVGHYITFFVSDISPSRFITEPYDFSSALPEEVKNLTVTSYNHDRVVLTWFPPSNVEVTSVIYDVACRVEDQPRITNRCKKLKYIPSHQQLLQTNVTITGFRNEGIQYVFEVRAKYSFYPSSQIDLSVEWNFASINYTGKNFVLGTFYTPFCLSEFVFLFSIATLQPLLNFRPVDSYIIGDVSTMER